MDSLCIKDMSGLLAPYDALSLIQDLKKALGDDMMIDLHSHFTCGLASATYLKAVEAGVDVIDTALSPFGHATSQPATESIVEMFRGTEYDTGLDLAALRELAEYFRGFAKKSLMNSVLLRLMKYYLKFVITRFLAACCPTLRTSFVKWAWLTNSLML